MTAVRIPDCITRLADSGPPRQWRRIRGEFGGVHAAERHRLPLKGRSPKAWGLRPFALAHSEMPQAILCLVPCRAAAGT